MADIGSADIELLTRELNLKETTPTTLHALGASFGRDWFRRFKEMNRDEIEVEDEKTGKVRKAPHPDSVAAWAEEAGVNVMAAEALHDKLRRLFDKEYIVEKPAADATGEMIKSLEAGKHVILSFGQAYETDLDYLLVSNLLTRKIKQAWENKTNEYPVERQGGAAPVGDRGGGSAQAAQPRDGRADHLRHASPGRCANTT